MGIRESPRHGPPWRGFGMKQFSLTALTIQNSVLILVLYHSRTMPLVGGHRYLASTAIVLAELLKLALCTTAALAGIARTLPASAPATRLLRALGAAVFAGDSWKLAAPAALYTAQHALQYLAASHMDAATLQVTHQFKILPTALFSLLILRRRLAARQWAALALLMLGVAAVQLPGAGAGAGAALPAAPGAATPLRKDVPRGVHVPRSLQGWRRGALEAVAEGVLHRRSATYEGIEEDLLRTHPLRSSMLGLAAALGSCTASALGSVYFEKILKEASSGGSGSGSGGGSSSLPSVVGTGASGAARGVSIWVRNVQLSVWALIPAFFVGVVFMDGETVARAGFLAGYNAVVWTVVACQAVGGILVALCVHHADNIAKSFATSISILLSLCASVVLFDFSTSPYFLLGTGLVIFATYLYNAADEPALHARPPPILIDRAVPEKLPLPEYHHRSGPAGPAGAPRPGDAVKLPTTPLLEEALTTSRPGSPLLHHARKGSARGSYFEAKKE